MARRGIAGRLSLDRLRVRVDERPSQRSEAARLALERREALRGAVPLRQARRENAGGHHSWLYEFPAYRSTIGRFLAEALGGPLRPDEAARVAASLPAARLPEGDGTPRGFSALEGEPGGFRTLARAIVTPDTEPVARSQR